VVAVAPMMRRIPLAWAVMVLAACGPGDLDPDGGDDDPDGRSGGLVFRWTAPDIDRALGQVTVESLELRLRDLRVVGDAAPGDARTYLAQQELELNGSDRETRFEDAPPGRYSSLEFAIARPTDEDSAWALYGTVVLGDETFDLEVFDPVTSPISLRVDLDLTDGRTRIVTIEVDVGAVALAIPWSTVVPDDDGDLVVEGESPLLVPAREALRAGFAVVDVRDRE
jgi:hypothetical protein